MRTLPPSDPPRHPANEALSQILADAIALAVQRPEVVEALRAAFTTQTPPPPKTSGLTKKELADAVGTSTSTVDRLCREGLPHTFVGDSKRFDLAACRAWLETRGRKPTTPEAE